MPSRARGRPAGRSGLRRHRVHLHRVRYKSGWCFTQETCQVLAVLMVHAPFPANNSCCQEGLLRSPGVRICGGIYGVTTAAFLPEVHVDLRLDAREEKLEISIVRSGNTARISRSPPMA